MCIRDRSWAVRENCSTMLGYLEREDTELAFKLLPACSPENWHFSEEFQAAVAAVGGLSLVHILGPAAIRRLERGVYLGVQGLLQLQ